MASHHASEAVIHPVGHRAKAWLRDWWRGYSESDRLSVLAKMSGDKRPGAVIPVTRRELRALLDERNEATRQWQQRVRG
jgi:hypothetical protein